MILNDVHLLTPQDTPSDRYVLKGFGNILSIIKWVALRALTFTGVNYSINTRHRTRNEVNGLRWVGKVGHRYGIQAPKLFDHRDTEVVVGFVEGIPLDRTENLPPREFLRGYARFGQVLAVIHSHGFSVGDTKAENILYDRNTGNVTMIDFEQFRKVDPTDPHRRAWDLTEFFFYQGHFFPWKHQREQGLLKPIMQVFLESYFRELRHLGLMEEQVQRQIFREVGKLRYSVTYLTFMSPLTYRFVKRTLRQWKSEFGTKHWSTGGRLMSHKLEEYIASYGLAEVGVRTHTFELPTRTAEEAAERLSVEVDLIIKSLVVVVGDQSYLVLIQGDRKLRQKAVRRMVHDSFGNHATDSRLATPDEVQALSGYPVGAVPPVGVDLPVIMDKPILDQTVVFGGGGRTNTILEVPVEVLLRTTEPLVGIVSKPLNP